MNDLEPIERAPAEPGASPAKPLLEIDNLQTHFFTAAGVVRAVDGVSYEVRAGESASFQEFAAIAPPSRGVRVRHDVVLPWLFSGPSVACSDSPLCRQNITEAAGVTGE